MPHKNKRQKIRAASRRFNITNYGSVIYKPGLEKPHKSNDLNTLQGEKLGTIANDFGSVRMDLVKIVILASLIIGLQIIIKISKLNFL